MKYKPVKRIMQKIESFKYVDSILMQRGHNHALGMVI